MILKEGGDQRQEGSYRLSHGLRALGRCVPSALGGALEIQPIQAEQLQSKSGDELLKKAAAL